LAELAPALYGFRNTSIEVLNLSDNNLNDEESAEILWDILRNNKTMTTLDLSGNSFGNTTGAVELIADGLGSNSTLLKIDLSRCILRDGGVSILARSLGSRNITLHKLALSTHYITSAGVAVLLDEAMQQRSPATDLELKDNPIGNESVILLARSLENNALSNLTRLSL
jgi:Ran GTPase-activating protein (RanGAP) involved in mRNA processing and transport